MPCARELIETVIVGHNGWTEIVPGYSAKQTPDHEIGFVRQDGSGVIKKTVGPRDRDSVKMGLYYARHGNRAAAKKAIEGYLVACFGKNAIA